MEKNNQKIDGEEIYKRVTLVIKKIMEPYEKSRLEFHSALSTIAIHSSLLLYETIGKEKFDSVFKLIKTKVEIEIERWGKNNG